MLLNNSSTIFNPRNNHNYSGANEMNITVTIEIEILDSMETRNCHLGILHGTDNSINIKYSDGTY